jgi:hypothetical protein
MEDLSGPTPMTLPATEVARRQAEGSGDGGSAIPMA